MGIPLGDGIHTISLYADDLLLYARDHHDIPPSLDHALNHFAEASGLRVNAAKSILPPFSADTPDLGYILGGTLVSWRADPFHYWGVRVHRTGADLLDGNILRATTAIHSQMNFWRTLPLAISGRIALIKMVDLPRLLYYCAVLPLVITPPFFRQWEGVVRDFIWGGIAPPSIHGKAVLTH